MFTVALVGDNGKWRVSGRSVWCRAALRAMSVTYSAARTNVKKIVQWLRGDDESHWEEQITLLSETISKLVDKSRPITSGDETGSRTSDPDVLPPGAVEINAAMPYLRGMLASMKRYGREYALEYGETALELLPER
jgi:hypothetical protein